MANASIALLPLLMEQYDVWRPGLRPAQEVFLQRVAAFLQRHGAVHNPGICANRSSVDAALAQAESEGADLLIVLLLSYTPSWIALPALLRTRLPILLLNTTPRVDMGPDISASDYLENHAIHGVQDLANVLLRVGKAHWIVSGLLEDAAVGSKVAECAAAASAARLWRALRVGRVGSVFPGMGDLAVDTTALLRSGPEVVDLAPGEFAAAWEAVADPEIEPLTEEYRRLYDTGRIGAEDLRATARAERAVRRIVSDHRLGAVAFSFLIFDHLPPGPVMPFAGVSRLMAEGVGYGGEADALAASAVTALHALTGCAGFTEMFCPDWKRDEVLMSHMGEANPQFARGRPRLVATASLVGAGAMPGVLLFESEPGPVTLASLTVGPAGRLRWVVCEGEISPSPLYPALAAPHYKFKPPQPLPEFLTAYSEAGGSHHLALCRGHVASQIERFAQAIGSEFCRV